MRGFMEENVPFVVQFTYVLGCFATSGRLDLEVEGRVGGFDIGSQYQCFLLLGFPSSHEITSKWLAKTRFLQLVLCRTNEGRVQDLHRSCILRTFVGFLP